MTTSIFWGWYNQATGCTKITTDYTFTRDTTIYAHWEHTAHDWDYTASGNKITAKCTVNGCQYYSTGKTLTLSASDENYSGSQYASASVSADADFPVSVTDSDIRYKSADGTTYPESATAPTKVGSYIASVTAGGATANQAFRINGTDFTGISAANVTGTYDGTTAYSITVTGAPADAEISYGTTEGSYSSTNPEFINAGVYTVYYKVTKENYNDKTGSATVTISQAAYPNEKTASANILAGTALTDVTVTLPPIPENMSYGTPTYNSVVTSASISGNKLKFSTNTSADAGSSYNITVPVTGNANANYDDHNSAQADTSQSSSNHAVGEITAPPTERETEKTTPPTKKVTEKTTTTTEKESETTTTTTEKVTEATTPPTEKETEKTTPPTEKETETTTTTTAPKQPEEVTIGGKKFSVDSTNLDLKNMKLTNKDIENLKYMQKLIRVDLSNNNLTDISVLKSLPKLRDICADNNSIADISFLKDMKSIERLSMSQNKVSDISVFKNLPHMKAIWLQENNVSDISPLKGCSELEELGLSMNKGFSDISALKGKTKLVFLHLGLDNIKDISVLSTCTALKEVYLFDNYITDFSALTKLEHLQIVCLNNNCTFNDEILQTLFGLQVDIILISTQAIDKLIKI